MTAIRHSLQKDLFEPDDERLLTLMHVSLPTKKKHTSFLCLTITTHHPVCVRLHELRKSDKDESYKKKRFWYLHDLKVVDGVNPRKLVPQFEIATSDGLDQYLVTNPLEKDPFIKQLWKLCNRYIPAQKPDFVNISLPVDELELANMSANISITDGISQQEADVEDYQPITVREEEDFRLLLQKCNMSVGHAEKFYDYLTRELFVLDSANIQAIMGSEMHLAELMNKIDSALDEASTLERLLDSYDELLLHVREAVEMMEEKDSLIHSHTANKQRLVDELHQFVTLIDFATSDQQILNDCQLTDPIKIQNCTHAAFALHKCLIARVSSGYEKLKAYNDQINLLTNLRDRFADRLVAHLVALIRNLTNEPGHANGLILPRHDSNVHLPLKPFSQLISWLKSTVLNGYKSVQEKYTGLCREMYQQEMVTFFDQAKLHVRPNTFERKPSVSKNTTNTLDLNRSFPKTSNLSKDDGDDHFRSSSYLIDAQSFKSVVDTIFDQIEEIIQAEQKFCIWFFHIVFDFKANVFSDNESVNSGDSVGSSTPEKRLERQYNEQVKGIMSRLFDSIDNHIQEFVAHCDKINPYYNIHLMALLSDRAMTFHKDASVSYLSTFLGKVVVLTKRRFDVLMENRARSMEDVYLMKKTKLGILPTLKNFEDLALETESAFKNCQRRGDLDRWYPQIVSAVCQSIEQSAVDPNNKSPAQVVRMENYHRLFSILSRFKIAVLDSSKKEAKQNYQQSLDSYVKEYMGKPMEKLQVFFEHIEQCLDQGMKPEAIAYQQNFSRQELRKALATYTGKDVKRGLEQLYKKVEKHLCDEENLLQVVWRNMCEEFLQQYKHYQRLIEQCYSGFNLQMDFTIQDVLNYFSDIAQQH